MIDITLTKFRLAAGMAVLALAVSGAAAVGVVIYRHRVYELGHEAGYAAAVAAGKAQYDREAAAARKTESDLRAELVARDADAFKKEQDHAASLEAAQRRMRAGVDSLRCPARPVPAAAAPGNRPFTSEPSVDGEGPVLLPEVAADVLGLAAEHQGLVWRYQRVVERFEACRALTAGP